MIINIYDLTSDINFETFVFVLNNKHFFSYLCNCYYFIIVLEIKFIRKKTSLGTFLNMYLKNVLRTNSKLQESLQIYLQKNVYNTSYSVLF